MIVIYPMLTSESVSPNVLPGLIKAVEKYVLIYNTDEVLRAGSGASAGQIISTGAQVVATAAMLAGKDNTLETGESISEAPQLPPPSQKPGWRDKAIKGAQIAQDVADAMPKKQHDPGIRLDFPRGEAVSLEPTYIQVTTKKKGLQILGVKVIPFKVKSGENMAKIMMQDQKLRKLDYLQQKYARMVARIFFRIMRKPYISTIKDKVISGDPKQDVLYANTRYGQNMFVCLSQMDLRSDDTFSSPATVQRLHKLGWASFIVTDDVTRRATFCMKEFGGMCSVVPYNFLYSSLGKEHAKVYEDLEDIKRTSGPFFNRSRTNRRAVFSEAVSATDKYLELIQK